MPRCQGDGGQGRPELLGRGPEERATRAPRRPLLRPRRHPARRHGLPRRDLHPGPAARGLLGLAVHRRPRRRGAGAGHPVVLRPRVQRPAAAVVRRRARGRRTRHGAAADLLPAGLRRRRPARHRTATAAPRSTCSSTSRPPACALAGVRRASGRLGACRSPPAGCCWRSSWPSTCCRCRRCWSPTAPTPPRCSCSRPSARRSCSAAAVVWTRSVGRTPSALHAWIGVSLMLSFADLLFNLARRRPLHARSGGPACRCARRRTSCSWSAAWSGCCSRSATPSATPSRSSRGARASSASPSVSPAACSASPSGSRWRSRSPTSPTAWWSWRATAPP